MGKQRHRNVKAKGKPSWAGQGKKEDKSEQ